jgi:hypothetical protein
LQSLGLKQYHEVQGRTKEEIDMKKGFGLIDIIITCAVLVGLLFYYVKNVHNPGQMQDKTMQENIKAIEQDVSASLNQSLNASATENRVDSKVEDSEEVQRPAKGASTEPNDNELYTSCKAMGGGRSCDQLCSLGVDTNTKSCKTQ